MGIDGDLDITAEHRATVHALLETYLPGTAAWAYGSRVTWTTREHSDLDLVVFATPEQSNQVGLLREAFEESNLPFRVDLFVWDAVPESFRRTIEMEHVVLSEHKKIPSGRRTGSLRHLAELRLSSVDKKTVEGESDVRLCNYTDVYYNDAIRTSIPFMRATATQSEIQKCRLLVNDVVITKDSEKHDDIGVPSLVKETMDDLVCGYHLAILRPRPWTHGPYLFYALSDRRAQHQFHAYANGITRFGLRKADIGLVDVPVPPLAEQRAIAAVLGALDDRIELNRRMNETLEAMARALFKSWFVDFDPVRAKMEGRDTGLPPEIADLFPARLVDSELGEIPEGWTSVPLADVIDINPPRSVPKGVVAPYLDMASIPTRGHIPQKIRRRTSGSGSRFRNGDTLVARITPCLENGKTAFVNCLKDGEIAWGSTEFIVLRPRPPVPNELAYCIARTSRFREYAIRSMTGTSGRQRVQTRAIAQFVVPRATPSIYAAFRDAVQVLFSQSMETERSSRVAASLRDSLLPKLVSGEVRLPAALVERHAEPDVRIGP